MAEGLYLQDGVVEVSDAERVFRVAIDRFELAAGQVVAFSGPSGSGKTMALELLGLMRKPGNGTRYHCDGQDLTALWASGDRLAKTRGALFGFVPQSGGLLPFLTVFDNIALPQQLVGRDDPGWCRDLLAHLALTDIASLYPDALSIGQHQRVAIARALSHRPRFVIADEPTAALDPESADRALDLLTGMVAELGCGLVLSSHDIDRIDRLGVARRCFAVTPGTPVISRLEEAPC